jgi:hypothetical protein
MAPKRAVKASRGKRLGAQAHSIQFDAISDRRDSLSVVREYTREDEEDSYQHSSNHDSHSRESLLVQQILPTIMTTAPTHTNEEPLSGFLYGRQSPIAGQARGPILYPNEEITVALPEHNDTRIPPQSLQEISDVLYEVDSHEGVSSDESAESDDSSRAHVSPNRSNCSRTERASAESRPSQVRHDPRFHSTAPTRHGREAKRKRLESQRKSQTKHNVSAGHSRRVRYNASGSGIELPIQHYRSMIHISKGKKIQGNHFQKRRADQHRKQGERRNLLSQ